MTQGDWRGLDDEALESRLVERWLYRGLLLALILVAAITVTYLGTRETRGVAEWVAIGVLIALSLAIGGASFSMRQQDLQIHTELRRRRKTLGPDVVRSRDDRDGSS